MSSADELRQTLRRIDGRGYKAYKTLRGTYAFSGYRLSIDHVQGDPFAAPSRVSLLLTSRDSGLPAEYAANRLRQIASGDYFSRSFAAAAARVTSGRQGTGGSGRIEIDCGKQQILERNSVLISPGMLETRFTMGLPAAGRRILASYAMSMFFKLLPQIVEEALLYPNISQNDLQRHVETYEDQQALRAQLETQGLVAFVADGSMLPRRSGVDDRPLNSPGVVPFKSPPELRCRLLRPHSGPIEGMGLPPGIHLIVGGGFHGKSTLLRGLERGIYDHIPGDGREWVISDRTACKIRAEDGRAVTSVDISPFISSLPMGRDTTCFSTGNASGSTSQAANIVEALEVGSRLLLIDEDTSASNFMQRDARMQRLIAKSAEPITPLIDRVRELHQRQGVSTILVTGGSGDYLDVADHVLQMDSYRPREVTARVQEIVNACPTQRRPETPSEFSSISHRVPSPSSFDPRRGRHPAKIDVRARNTILFGRSEIDLSLVEQLVDRSQTRAVGLAMHYLASRLMGPNRSLSRCLESLDEILNEEGLDALSPFKVGNLARPRRFEIAAAINRLRSLGAKLLKVGPSPPE